MAIFNISDLEKYIVRLNLNKELLDISPVFSDSDKIRLHEIYDEQIIICQNRIEVQKVATKNATNIKVVEPVYIN